MINRRTFSLTTAAGLAMSGTAHAQSTSEQLDTDDGSYELDAAARDHLHWWTTPAGVTRAYAGAAGQQMHVRLAQPVEPKHRPVMVLHRAGLSGRMWNHAMAALAADRAVIAPDLPAHGDSDGAPGTSVSGHALSVLRLADHLTLGRFDVVGDGLGAEVALALAAMAPLRIGKVMVSGVGAAHAATPRPDPTDPENDGFLTAAWQTFTETYAPDTPVGLLDRDFADLLRSRADRPRPSGVGSLDMGRVAMGGNWRGAMPSRQPDTWASQVRRALTDTADAVSVGLPSAPPPRDAIVRRFMATEGGQMHYRIIAAGDDSQPPLLCFHMSPRSGAYYEAMMTALAMAGRTVLAVDTAGYGESFKPQEWLNVPGYAAHMANFIDALTDQTGATQVDLMGDHTGAKIAIETARQRPDEVRRVVMNTAGVYSREEQKGWQNAMGAIPVAADGSHFAALWERYHRLNRGKLDSGQNAFRFYETVRAGPCMWWGSRAANLYILGEVLPEIDHQILLICSDEDSLIEPSRRGAKLLKNGRYVEFAGQGNSMVEYRAMAAAPTIARFLSR